MSDADHDCPTCGKSLASDHGVKAHHAHVHDESLADHYEWECDVCGAQCSRPAYEIGDDWKPRYCGSDCREIAREESLGYHDRVELTCEECEESFEVRPSKAEGRRFCDPDCYRASLDSPRSARGEADD